MIRRLALLSVLLAPVLAAAETLYVTERLATALRTTFADDSVVIKYVEAGTALDVLERVDRFAHVRDPAGVEGWIDARFLVNQPAARAQLERAQAEQVKLRKDLADAQGRIKELEANLARPTEGAESPPPASTPVAEEAKPEVPPPVGHGFNWGWLVLAFAMLWIGFGAGVVWLRERERKKLGGMYLRI